MKKAQVIPPDAYPQMASKSDALKMARALRAPETAARGARVIEDAAQTLRKGVHDYVRELEAALGDHRMTFEKAHEIRGFAETAGLRATGRIASGLCRYFDEMQKLDAIPDAAVIALHVSAIVRAAHAKDEAGRMSDTVVKELAALVTHKLAETRTTATA
jgi:preprotein translocase subunit Sec61beta